MNCKTSFPESPLSKALREAVGSNDLLYATYTTEILDKDTGEISQDFIEKLQAKTGVDINAIPESKVNDVVQYVREYYNSHHPDINFSSRIQSDSTPVGRFGYSSVGAREFSKRIAANFALDVYHQILHEYNTSFDKMLEEENAQRKADGLDKVNKKTYIADAVTAKIEQILVDRLVNSTNLTEDKIYDILDEGDIARLESLFGEHPTIQNANLMAVYKEIIANREGFFTEVYRDSRLGELRFDKTEEIGEEAEYEKVEEGEEQESGEDAVVEEESTSTNTEVDNSIANLNNKMGESTSYMINVNMGIRSYLNSLKRLTSGKKTDEGYQVDTNNELGIADTMNAEECAAVLYSYGDYTNVHSMIESIRTIADNVPGFAAFHQMADYLDTNPDFAYEVYRTFGKIVVSKLETVMDGGNVSSRTSNRSADKVTSLRFEFLNSVKSTSILLDDVNSKAIYTALNEKLDGISSLFKILQTEGISEEDYQSLKEDEDRLKQEITADLTKQLRRYYPTVADTAIVNYLRNAREGDFVANASALAGILRDTITASYATQQNYNDRQAEIGRAYAHNKKLDARKVEGEKVRSDEYIDMTDLYATNYIDNGTQAAAFKLANELVKYTAVRTELNSRNVHGNQSSDVINNSMITNVMNTLKSTIALENFGKYKSQSRQYDFSNIMIEHRDEKGNIINYGLFRRNPETNDFTPTEYAQRMLKTYLFNGASDIGSSTNALYSEMSKGDYVATGFINFFRVEDDYNNSEDGGPIDFANYFMRIPSDAPKNFSIRAPRYSVSESRAGANGGLFRIDNLTEANKMIQQRINALSPIREEEFQTKYSTLVPINSTLKQLISRSTAKNLGNIQIPSIKFVNEEGAKVGDEVTVTFNYKTKDGVDNMYVVKGKLAQDNGKYILQSPSFVGFSDYSHSSDVNSSLRNHFEKQLIKSGDIKRSINTSHPIYQQMRQIFVQELNDAANTIDRFFINQNGQVLLDENGMPVFKEGFANDEATARSLYAIYHVAKNKTIYDVVNGQAVLTGSVFNSDRFTITHTKPDGTVEVKNYGQEILNEAFNLLYGGAQQSHIATTRTAKGVNVVLTEAQEAKIAEKLSEFINDFVKDTENRIEQFREFIPEHLLTNDNVTEFALNYHIMYVGFNDLFEGDTKFYKDNQTFLKRSKESQGSGVPYGIVDYNMDLSSDITPIPSRLDQTTFTRVKEDGTTEEVKIGLRNKFKGITIKNTVRTNKDCQCAGFKYGDEICKEDGAVVKHLIKTLRQAGFNAEEARAKAVDMMTSGMDEKGRPKGGYANTTVNDAQSYITFEEWVRRVTARGQLQKYKPMIEAILDETKPVDAATIAEFVQVQKNFYYDQHYNARLGIIAPRQIKNAEFVLVPRFIKGTQLEQVYELMKKHDIDQLNTEETSKAGKCNVITIWNNDGEITTDAIADFEARATEATELYNYNYLYTQQETPQHINAENKAGIQIMKKILDNIAPGSKLYDIKQKFFGLYSANIKASFRDLMDELNLELDENGNLKIDENGEIQGLDYQIFYDRLQEEVARLGLDSNMMDFVTLDQDGNTVMPTYMSNISSKLESIAQSMFNSRITRQKLPGFHAAQITNVGFSARNDVVTYKIAEKYKGKGNPDTVNATEYAKLKPSDKAKYIKQKGNIATSHDLKYHPQAYTDGTRWLNQEQYDKLDSEAKKNFKKKIAPYVEIMLPASNFGLQRIAPDGHRKTDVELLEELQESGLDTMIGYRIPTEGKQSICVMKIAGFTDDALGSTIVVPDDWVSQTGSDFDIDSVYGINYKGRINRKTGKIERINYVESSTQQDYFDYLRRRSLHKLGTNVKNDIESLKIELSQALEEQWTENMEKESELYHSLPKDIREEIKRLQNIKVSGEKKDKFVAKNNNVVSGLQTYLENHPELDEETKNTVQQFIDIHNQINDFVNNTDGSFNEDLHAGIQEILDKRLANVEAKAKKAGLPSYAEFCKLSVEERNSKDARNNELLQCMIDILSAPESVEENLSRSNFEDIIDARDKAIDKNVSKRRKARSPYNFFDQAEAQEDVMSGAKLKAFSVTRDTFCSICNTVRPTIADTHTIKVVYKAEDGYTFDALKKTFDNVEKIDDNTFVVEHNTIGWTKNNRNTREKLLTAYSSQTTAHILDAVKEGAIPNVNDLTFQVYKLFPDVGSDYETGVAFIMQPGITRLVEAYNSSKSIYSKGKSNPVYAAIRSLATDILAIDGIEVTNSMSIDSIIQILSKHYSKELSTMFGAAKENYKISLEDKENAKLLISASRLNARLKEEGIFAGSTPVEGKRRLLFDLGTLLQYNKLSHLGNSISNYARVCNPDKFGAKQTIFATNEVFDNIKQILADEAENPVLTVAKKSDDSSTGDGRNLRANFLQAIYPGMTSRTTVNEYIKSTNMDSAYYPLHNFLKYATATSIKINRKLFATQNPEFVEELIRLERLFSGAKPRMTEKIYKDFQNYVLNYLYTQTSAVKNPTTYRVGQGFVQEANGDVEAERSRIFGYGKTPNIIVDNGKGDMVEFTVADINNPTEAEIDAFATLSPAQKITWIQANFAESGVFKYIRATLFNDRQYRRTKAGSQTIEFIEGNENIETIYSEFEKCFFNDNPLVALTALDVVKYAFAVEGFRMKRNAVNKMIKNSVLLTDKEQQGTGIVKELNEAIKNVKNLTLDMETLRDRFIRSHSTLSQIETHRVETTKDKRYELNRREDGIIIVDPTSEYAKKYGFTYDTGVKGEHGTNSYVKLRFGKKTVLYKIVEDYTSLGQGQWAGVGIFAYPVNLLEENETENWSVNPTNNTFALDAQYYENIFEDLKNDSYEAMMNPEYVEQGYEKIVSKHKDKKEQYRVKSKAVAAKSTYATTFDINETNGVYAGGFEDVRNAVEKHFEGNPKGRLYIRSGALANFIKHTGPVNGSIQTIGGRQYLIQKADFSRYNRIYIGDKNAGHKVKEKDPQIQAIMEKAQDSGYRVNDAFLITPYFQSVPTNEDMELETNEVMHSTVTELGTNSMNAMYRRQISENDVDAGKALRRLKDKDITSKDASVKANINEVITTTAEYVQVATSKILNDLEYFIQDVDGVYHSVNEAATVDLIRNNPQERQRFLKTLLDARAFVRNYRIINELDIDAEDAELRPYLNKIKEAIDKLRNATIINNAEERFANEYLAKLSDNPLVQADIISLLDGYHSAGAFDAWVNDLQETSSPLLQIITKEVMGDIRAKEMLATKRIREFKKAVVDIKARAGAAGINWKHIIDEDGKFIQDYNQAFLDKIQELRDKISEFKSEYRNATDEATKRNMYEQYLKAKFEYDKFKLNHVHQQLVDDYYQRKLELERRILFGDTTPEGITINKYSKIYSAYKLLEERRREILSHMVNGTLDETYQDELKEVKKQLDNLTSPYFYDPATGMLEEKFSVDDPSNPLRGDDRLIHSIEAAEALKAHLGAMKDLRNQYYTHDAKFGFDEELEKNLDIISNYEMRDASGRITTPMAELMKHDDYVKAKEWIEHNARYVIGPELQRMINEAFAALREGSEGRKVLSTIARHKNLYDSHGVIDATKLSDEDIEHIRHEQEVNYNIREGEPFSDRSLISCSPTDRTVFKSEFYRRMTMNGTTNPQYLAKVTQINSILAKYYSQAERKLLTYTMSEADLEALDTLYGELEEMTKTDDSTNGKAVRKFIKNNVKFVSDDAEFNIQEGFAITKGARYHTLWKRVNLRIQQDEEGNDVAVPNRFIYGYAVPKGYDPAHPETNSWVDMKKTKALQTINGYCTTTKTEYYYQKYREMRALSDDEFNAWYDKNHIYNPYTHSYEPLQCWTRMEINPMADDGEYEEGGMWIPAFNQIETRPKNGKDKNGNPNGDPDYTNPNFKQGASTAANYKTERVRHGEDMSEDPFGPEEYNFTDGVDYSNRTEMTPAEREMKQLFEQTLREFATTSSAKRFLDRGYMASRAKNPERDAKFYAKEALKMLGWIEGASGRESWYEDIDYATDKTIDMPMMSMLKSKDSVTVNHTAPKSEDFATEAEYQAALDKYNIDKKAAEEQNAKVHREMLDNDWESVMEDFITKAAHFNAVQDNKYMLFYAKQMIDKIDVYVKNEGFNDLQRINNNDPDADAKYVTKKDTRLQEQYANWIRRLVYDQWKKPNNSLTRAANILQSLTSAKFMMLNVTGGIANITVGETQIIGEAFAKEYFGAENWAKGLATWRNGIPSYLADMYDEKATSLASAICKFMNVVDFDELNGVVHVPNAEEYMKRVRDAAFSPQSMGEHFMQNGAMFSMMHSHRLVANPNSEENGHLTYIVMNEAEYMRDANERALQGILTDEQKSLWDKFVEYETKDANKTKQYAWFRKDLTTEFANLYLDNAQKEQFIAKRRELQKQAKEEFNNDETHPTLFSQLKLGTDGKLDFKDDSILSSMGDEAFQLLGRFKGRVISVNKKIHGVYDRLGAAKWESYWWGGLVMQYHKHIYPGIMKRYRRQGYFNEERGTIEKGCYASIKDFLALPLHKVKFANKLKEDNNMSDSELQAVKGLQNLVRSYVDFITHIRLNWNMLPEYERANMKRALGDVCGVLSAVCLAIALRCMFDDDDDSIIYNLMMYEADRLASEAGMYNPLGLYSEGKKLWSSPVAVQGSISDAFHTVGLISQYILQGDEFDPYYRTGLYAGENKLWVTLRRNIPMYHAINMVERLNRSNKYYKLGDNMLSIIPVKDIADWIRK